MICIISAQVFALSFSYARTNIKVMCKLDTSTKLCVPAHLQ